MAIVINCAQCNRRYSVGEQLGGKRVKCKSCGAAIPVPLPTIEEVGEDFDALSSLEPSRADPPMTAPPMPRHAPAYAPPPPAAPMMPRPLPAQTAYNPRAAARSRDRQAASIPMPDRLAGFILVGAGIALVLSLVTFGLTAAGVLATKMGLILVFLCWIPILLANGLMVLYLIAQESVVCLLMYFVVPFYGLYYVISRWHTMGRPVLIHVVGVIVLIGSVKQLAPQAEGATADEGSADSVASRWNRDTGDGEPESTGSDRPPSSSRPRRIGEPPPQRDPVQISEEQQRFDQMAGQVRDFVRREFRGVNREQALAEWTALKNAIAAERKQVDSRVMNAGLMWGQLESQMSMMKGRLESLPSELPPPTVYQESTDAGDPALPKRPDALGEEVSYRAFRIRPPAEGLLDLSSSDADDERGMVWNGGSRGGVNWTMSVRQVRKSNPKQKQPWIADHAYAVSGAAKENLLLIDRRESNWSVHSINGLRFWRTQAVSRQSPVHAAPAGPVRYVASVGDDWLTVEFSTGEGTGRYATTELLDDAVRSIRPQKAGEPKADPFTPDRIVKRLADQPEHALRILKSHRSAAEPLMLPLLGSTDPAVARAAASFLADFGTKDSLPALRKAAESADLMVADPARVALRRLAPTEFDAIAELMLDLKGADASRRSAAVAKVIETPVKPERRLEIATILEDLLLNDSAGVEREPLGKALVAWHTDKTATRLLPILSQEEVDTAKRDAAMDVIAACKSKPGAGIVIRWLLKEPEKTMATLIRMGDVAEEPTLKMYNSISMTRDPAHVVVRANCVRILSEVGVTTQSIAVLTRASKDTRDLVTQDVAKAGIESIKARIAAKKPM